MNYDIASVQQQVQSSISKRQFIGNYEIVRKIGEGTFSSVFLAIHIMTRHNVVLKSTEKNQTNLASEIANMSLLYHPHIVRLYEYIVTGDKVWLVLEYCGGEELFSYLVHSQVIAPAKACQLFAQLAGAVAYAHQRHCAHRDLKLENILLDENGTVKLGDFGFTRSYVPKTMLETVCGTESYMAPELLMRKKYYPEAADVWSLGVILYAMIYGRFPFDDDNAAATNRKVIEEDPPFPPVDGGAFLVEITQSILVKDPRKRPTVAAILERLGESGKQQQQLLTKLEKYPEVSNLFTSKEEKAVLKGMKVLNIDLHAVASSVVNHKCDPLHGLWYTALDRQRYLKSQDTTGDAPLRRHRSIASTHSARSFVSHSISRTSQKPMSRQSSVRSNTQVPQRSSQLLDDDSSSELDLSPAVTGEPPGDSAAAGAAAVAARPPLAAESEKSDEMSRTSSSPDSGASQATRIDSFHSSVETSGSSIDAPASRRSRRTFEKLWSALRWKRNAGNETLIAYYRPTLDATGGVKLPVDNLSSTIHKDSHSGLAVTPRGLAKTDTPLKLPPLEDSSTATPASVLPSTPDISPPVISPPVVAPPVINLGIRGLSPAQKHSASKSVSDTLPLDLAPDAAAPTRSSRPSVTLDETERPVSQISQISQHNQHSAGSQTSARSSVSAISQGSQGSPRQPTPTTPTMSTNTLGIRRNMSTYSEMSTLSQISESSVDATQLLSEVEEPQAKTTVSQRWRSFANSGLVKSSNRNSANGTLLTTPPGTPTLRQRARILNVHERIPQKIDESEGEGEGDDDQ